jgi:CBS domain-containing protein
MRALEAGVTVANTYRRLDRVVEAGAMNENDASSLRDALILISRVRLDYQAQQMGKGKPPGNFVPAEDLSPLMRRNLKAAFMLVVDAQTGLTSRYQLG